MVKWSRRSCLPATRAIVSELQLIRAKQLVNAGLIHKALEGIHIDVAESSTQKRKQSVASHNRKTGVKAINFYISDFVLRGLLQRERGRKPSLRCNGPYQVFQCRSDYIFPIEDLMTGRKEEKYGLRLRFFSNKLYNVTEALREHLQYHHNELLCVERLEDIRDHQGKIELKVKWRVFRLSSINSVASCSQNSFCVRCDSDP